MSWYVAISDRSYEYVFLYFCIYTTQLKVYQYYSYEL